MNTTTLLDPALSTPRGARHRAPSDRNSLLCTLWAALHVPALLILGQLTTTEGASFTAAAPTTAEAADERAGEAQEELPGAARQPGRY
ncbi:hypothetical protein [Streptomyces sp. TR02-1]|uniref:hypothetical protein n=1 Tax=Streptomyces sp. TR02-1 TaxID=3385977 RepID=UPI0039A2B8E0